MMLDEAIGGGAAQRIFTLRVLTAFVVVALLLAALGKLGVLSYGVRLRAREFSIRLALRGVLFNERSLTLLVGRIGASPSLFV